MITLLDCTLRDGGYYNDWNFSKGLIQSYLDVLDELPIDVAEIGFRSLATNGFRGPCAYTTERFLSSLKLPSHLELAVMVNAAELVGDEDGPRVAVERMFYDSADSAVGVVRLACHFHEVAAVLPAIQRLQEMGYKVCLNLMQIGLRTDVEIREVAALAEASGVDVIYFADSLGNLSASDVHDKVANFRTVWTGPLGVHAHDNLGLALSNTLSAIGQGVTWVDGTVTGMGRGPGNAKTELLLIELEQLGRPKPDLSGLMDVIDRYFKPLHQKFQWGTNTFYYLAGRYGIHPTYVQEMLSDPRYGPSETLAVLEHLHEVGGHSFSATVLDAGRQMYGGEVSGTWDPTESIAGRDVLLIGAGPTVQNHADAIEAYIRARSPYVIALNTQSAIDDDLIDARAVCHPFRLLADCQKYKHFSQPVIIPGKRIPDTVKRALDGVEQLDFGLKVEPDRFEFEPNGVIAPTSLVASYALGVGTSGHANRLLLAGFDGYESDDPRTIEMGAVFTQYAQHPHARPLLALTPTRYRVPASSVYAM